MIPAQAIRASTQDHLEIEDIKDSIVILKDGGACLVISVTSINYDLLSEKEQEAIIYAYAGLLNSLTFPIQIVIRSQQKDVSAYLKLLEEMTEKESRPLIKEQIIKYAKFVGETVKKNNVLDKKFYIVIPMSALEIGAPKAFVATLKPGKRKLPFDKTYILKKAKINLYPKRDHILRLLNRLGIKGHQLETKELIKLFFEIYNPESPGQQIIEGEQYQKPLVQSTMPTITPEISPPPFQENIGNQKESYSSATVFEKINSLVKEATKTK
ncbi:MAG: hypothetical protein ACPLXP_00175 [Microgenomates group bacterium]